MTFSFCIIQVCTCNHVGKFKMVICHYFSWSQEQLSSAHESRPSLTKAELCLLQVPRAWTVNTLHGHFLRPASICGRLHLRLARPMELSTSPRPTSLLSHSLHNIKCSNRHRIKSSDRLPTRRYPLPPPTAYLLPPPTQLLGKGKG